jgi:hypothetical protein
MRTTTGELIQAALDATREALAEADADDGREVYNLIDGAMESLEEAQRIEALHQRAA